MTHTAIIKGQEFWWTATLPDQIHLTQGALTDADPNAVFALDNGQTPGAPPLTINVHYTPEALFGEAHGILTMQVAEPADQDYYGTPEHYADTGNGLRGTINVVFHNDLGVPLHDPPGGLADGGATLAVFLGGVADQTAPTTVFHTPYVHVHATPGMTLDQAFPGVEVRGQVGPLAIGGGGNPNAAPNWILIAGEIPAGGTNYWGPLTLHARDLSPGPDDFSLSFAVLSGALTESDFAQLRSDYAAAHTDPLAMG
jgi:hypothetical protein